MKYENKTFTKEPITLDNNEYNNCKFINCQFITSGKPWHINNCQVTVGPGDTFLGLQGEAQATVALLNWLSQIPELKRHVETVVFGREQSQNLQ